MTHSKDICPKGTHLVISDIGFVRPSTGLQVKNAVLNHTAFHNNNIITKKHAISNYYDNIEVYFEDSSKNNNKL